MVTEARPSTFSAEQPGTPVQYVKGVGPQRAEILNRIGVRIFSDLLYYLPRDHQDRRIVPIRQLVPGRKNAIAGEVLSSDVGQVGKMLGQARAQIRDASGVITAVWFKRLSFKYDVFSTQKRYLVPGAKVLVFGSVEAGRDGGLELRADDFEPVAGEADPIHVNRIVPVYPLTEGLQDRWLRTLTARAVPALAPSILDPLPAALRQARSLLPLAQALGEYHFPNSWAERDRARERLAFDEFFLLELALALNRRNRESQAKGFQSILRKHLLTPFRAGLAFEFTRAQSRAINEILRDMERPTPMNRLLQGDVGSGKTVVALTAALLAVENGRQAAFLAPTEILAAQHALSIQKLLGRLPVRTAFLTGSTPAAERKKILAELSAGRLQLLVGTHAILNEEVQFKQLGLVVIDEQHRFGVRQRERLMTKAEGADAFKDGRLIDRTHPDVLIMTATPIPRTLAMTLYGDLDVTVIDELPAGRSPIRTSLVDEAAAFRRIDARLSEGRQAYLVFPFVEESETLAKKGKIVQAAAKELDRIRARFPTAEVALLHGQMSADDKAAAMEAFRSGRAHILVATPVIEVGIDVPNAAVIAIANPERFGLAQLHQLRGRVGRGSHASECLLIAPPSEEPNERLDVFCALSDGFRLAEEDLRLRGPGEFLGEAQHGVPLFRVGDLMKDALLISQARDAARTLVEGEIPLTLGEYDLLNRALYRRFGNKIQLSRVG